MLYFCPSRTLFRALLLQNIDVQFGKQVDRYSLDSPAKKVSVHFSDGSSATGDFLVGADGLRSVIRKQLLPQHIPVDTTGRCIYGKTPITPKLLESFPKELHDWMSLTIDDTGLKPLSLLTEPLYFSDEAKALSTKVLPNASEDYIYWVRISMVLHCAHTSRFNSFCMYSRSYPVLQIRSSFQILSFYISHLNKPFNIL